MILTHYTGRKFTLNLARTYEQYLPRPYGKPRGLWLSDDSDYGWAQWCRDEKYQIGRLDYVTRIEVDTSRLAVLSTPHLVREFTARYMTHDQTRSNGYGVDWARAAKDYAGILATPYWWECRLDDSVEWYYVMDCASACVWDLSVVSQAGPSVRAGDHVGHELAGVEAGGER